MGKNGSKTKLKIKEVTRKTASQITSFLRGICKNVNFNA
jgi:hypothetical protein